MKRLKLAAWALFFALLALHGRRSVRTPAHSRAQPGQPIQALLIKRGTR